MSRYELFSIFALVLLVPAGMGATIARADPSADRPDVPPPYDCLSERMIDGAASVLDGDTLEVAATHAGAKCIVRVSLAGIDAPELEQSCLDGARTPWRCGAEARNALFLAVAWNGRVECIMLDKKHHGSGRGVCWTTRTREYGWDLGESMVLRGLALDDPNHKPDYSNAEAEARTNKSGMHSGNFVIPSQWRNGERLCR